MDHYVIELFAEERSRFKKNELIRSEFDFYLEKYTKISGEQSQTKKKKFSIRTKYSIIWLIMLITH